MLHASPWVLCYLCMWSTRGNSFSYLSLNCQSSYWLNGNIKWNVVCLYIQRSPFQSVLEGACPSILLFWGWDSIKHLVSIYTFTLSDFLVNSSSLKLQVIELQVKTSWLLKYKNLITKATFLKGLKIMSRNVLFFLKKEIWVVLEHRPHTSKGALQTRGKVGRIKILSF